MLFVIILVEAVNIRQRRSQEIEGGAINPKIFNSLQLPTKY